MADSESEILVSRFRPEQRTRLAADLEREDDLLREYIELGKLDFWFQEILVSTGPQASSELVAPSADAGTGDLASVDSKARLTWV